MNNFPAEHLDNSAELYADDGTIQAVDSDIKVTEEILTNNFAKAVEWMKKNKMTVHLGKTMIQLIGSH